jgi:uncharacterized protein
MKSMNKDEQFQRGISLFNAGEFFEAHEVWEEIWLAEAEPEKTFLQGLIQIAAAFHHYCRENTDGTETLLAAGIVKLSRFPREHRGLAIEDLRLSAKEWARNIGKGEKPERSEIPRLRFSETHPAIDGPGSKDRR